MMLGLAAVGIAVHVSTSACGNMLVAAAMRRRRISLQGVVLGSLLLAAGFGTYATLLHFLPLSIVAPAGASSYLLVTLLSRSVLRERIPALRWKGIALLTSGVLLILLSQA